MDVLRKLEQAIMDGETVGPGLVREALGAGVAPTDVLAEAIAPAMVTVGENMESGECSMFEVVVLAREAQRAMDVIRPKLVHSDEAPSMGTVIVGAIEGDFYSVDNNLTRILLKSAGFEVVDLGVDVAASHFVTAAIENQAKIMGISALLSTTMVGMQNVIQELNASGYRDHVKVLLQGPPVTEHFTKQIGADGYGESAAASVRQVRRWVREGRD